MSKRIFPKVLLVVVAVFGLLVLSNVLSAQGLSQEAFERVKEVQERHTDRLLGIKGVEGTAIGFNQNNRLALKVFVARWDVAGIPKKLDDVPVQVVVTGKFYALPKPENPPGQAKKDRPPAAPTGLTATADISNNKIDLDWDDNSEPDMFYYNVYRSTTSGSYGDPIVSVDKSDSRYSDTGLEPSIYYYVVTAVDLAEHESDYSNEAWATTDPGYEPPVDPTARFDRPVPIGVSTGHPDITAGTIGCRVTDGTNVYALSNNHIYANSNEATIGDNVLQPGDYDGGIDPDDAIGTLYAFEVIEFGPRGSNTIDAAIAEIIIDKVDGVATPRVGNATPDGGYEIPKSIPVDAELDQLVQKYGRTTGLTQGKVTGVDGAFRVHYSSGFAIFVGQIVIEGIEGAEFSAGGDSGSLIVTDPEKKPVGLLFAGGGGLTIANPIDAVLSAFGVDIDGE